MKKFALSIVLAVAASICAAAPDAAKKTYKPISYDKDMAETYGSQPAAAWQSDKAVADAIAAATAPDVLEESVKDDASAAALLAEVKGAYDTDPVKATQIAAVSQLVMRGDCPCRKIFLFWTQTNDDRRKIWTGALLAAAKNSEDPYVKIFMLDQLRWCGYPKQAPEVSAFRASGNKAVADMAEIAAKELASAAVED